MDDSAGSSEAEPAPLGAVPAHGARCEYCGQPLLEGRCTLCGGRPREAPAPRQGPLFAGPTPTPAPSPTAATVDDEHKISEAGWRSSTGIAAIAAGSVALLGALYLVVAVAGLRSDVHSLKVDQRAANDRIKQLQGDSSALSNDNASLHSTLDAQKAADPTSVATKVQPSVYTIEVTHGLGSGWVAKSDATTSQLVTNYHVVEESVVSGSNYVRVYQDKGNVLDGTVILADKDHDLALVSVNAQLPVLQQSTGVVRAGQPVLVVGSPLGLGSSVSTGSVANPARDIDGNTYVQFTAPISPGNSGGPVVDLSGKVIAVTEAKAVFPGAEGLGFAIPVTNVCTILHVCAT